MDMFNNWRVVTFTRNKADGEAEFTDRFESEQDAYKKFRSNVASYGNNDATKACQIMLFAPWGELVKEEAIDNSRYIAD